MVGLNTVALLFPAFGFLLDIGYLMTNCDLRCFVSLAGITVFSNFVPALGMYLPIGLTHPCRRNFRHFLL